MADIKWIKITTDIFDDEKILLIETLPDADSVIVIWFKLLCLAGKQNNCGVLTLNDKIPYTEEMLSTIFRRPLNTVKLALATFEQYGMIEILNGVISIPNWEKHQNIDGMDKVREQTRLRTARCRERQKELECSATVTLRNAIEEDKNRKEKNINNMGRINNNVSIKSDAPSPRKPYGSFKNVFLSDEELDGIKKELPDNWEARIEKVSLYCGRTHKTYPDYYATVIAWAKEDAEKQKTAPASYPSNNRPSIRGNFEQREYDDAFFDSLYDGNQTTNEQK